MNEEIYFSKDISERERASFEIGIKLGTLYHTIIGLPISSNPNTIESIEKGFEASISCQPYVKDVKVSILKEKISGDKTDEFDYDEISAPLINAEIILEYKNTRVIARVKWIDKLQYPLMYIEKIENII
ncbi:MAG: dihydroneopterin aldolase [Promethearchaeota archaeon]|nr:MAG: dihydroneopterin aldolase [Candidatus Lokiarchaeota archaeon]